MDTLTNNANLGFLRGEIAKRIEQSNIKARVYKDCPREHRECMKATSFFEGQADSLTDLLRTLDAQAEQTAESNSAQTNPKTVLAFLGWLTLAYGCVSLITWTMPTKGNNEND